MLNRHGTTCFQFDVVASSLCVHSCLTHEGALLAGLGVTGVDGAHGTGQVDGNDEVVVGKGGHVVLLLDELV